MSAILGIAADKEYLLLGDYNSSAEEFHPNCDSGSENENSFSPAHCSDAEDSSSSTDIDAVVQEYRERIQVSNLIVRDLLYTDHEICIDVADTFSLRLRSWNVWISNHRFFINIFWKFSKIYSQIYDF